MTPREHNPAPLRYAKRQRRTNWLALGITIAIIGIAWAVGEVAWDLLGRGAR